MKTITSRSNAIVKRIRAAIHEHGQEIVLEGPKAVADAIARGWTAIARIERGVDVTDDVFDSLAETRTPQNVIGLFARPHAAAADILARRDLLAVALDGVQDPGNVGTIVRLIAAFDGSGLLLLPRCADPYSPKAIRASAGAILGVAVANVTPRELIDANVALLAASASGSPIEVPSRDAVLVFGSEGGGISEEILRHSKTISIPISPRVESLNVASAAAILLARSFLGARASRPRAGAGGTPAVPGGNG